MTLPVTEGSTGRGMLRNRIFRMLECMAAFARQVSACLLVAALVGALAPEVRAAELGRFSDWDRTPAAYYLTDTERAGWKTVTTEAEAESFVAGYMNRRGPQFERELRKRIEIADRTFSSGKVRGSETLRGRIVIVLGPPAKFEHVRPEPASRIENADLANIYTNVGPMGSQSTRYQAAPDLFTFVYPADPSCKAPSCTHVIRVEADPASGKERLPSKAAEKELERMLKNAVREAAETSSGTGATR